MRRVLVPTHVADAAPPAGGRVHRLCGETMGTTWSVQLCAGGDAPDPFVKLGIRAQLDAVVDEMSHWQPDSDLSRFNRAPAGTWCVLPLDFYKVLACAAEVRKASGGAYDPFAGALVKLWGFGAQGRYDEPGFIPPTQAAIDAALAHGRARGVSFNMAEGSVQQPGGVQLDLSSIAKGFAVDQVALCLEAMGVCHYLVEVGGELRGAGMKPDRQPWWVELESVAGDGLGQLGLALHGLAVATSGDYRRSFEHDGERRAHTIDPRSGHPVANGVASVTVIHAECMMADALSTALTVLGPQAGLVFAEQQDLAARFVVRASGGFAEYMTARFREMLQ